MTAHRTARAFRPGRGWCSRCWCGWTSELDPGWTSEVDQARVLGRAHEAQPGPVDWSVVDAWLRQG